MTSQPPAPARRHAAFLLAEYESAGACLHAAARVREAGYEKFDAHTPFPVHGMDRAMGLRDSRLGWIVLAAAATGLGGAYLMMWWMNGVDYPLVVGGKPAFVIPPIVPVLFEATVLLSAFGAVFGMFALNRLPRHHHPLFESERFRRASDDRFFVSIDVRDPKFDVDGTRRLLESTNAVHIEAVEEDE